MPRSFALVSAIAAALVAASCSNSPTAEGPVQGALTSAIPEVVISNRIELNQAGDPYEVVGEPKLDGDVIRVSVQHAGGCARHEFTLINSGVFMESEPVQTGLTLRHNANGDNCRAMVSADLAFDLSPLKRMWQQSYRQDHGRMTLHLSGARKPLLYTF